MKKGDRKCEHGQVVEAAESACRTRRGRPLPTYLGSSKLLDPRTLMAVLRIVQIAKVLDCKPLTDA